MLLTITACLLAGAAVGLKFNVRVVFHLALAALLVAGIVAATGQTGWGLAALYGIAAVISLQCGYFVSLLINALGLTREPVDARVPLASDRPAKQSFDQRKA